MSLPVPRTCTPVPVSRGPKHRDAGAPGRDEASRPLEAYREAPAWVLLGDPGAGKTTALRCESEALGDRALFIAARDFLASEPTAHPEWRSKTLFIDGLDEVRAGTSDVRQPFDAIRKHLDALGRPRFRLSCRTADWLGANDRRRLQSVAADNELPVLFLDPLLPDDAARILGNRDDIADAESFIESAESRGLGALLANPQSLGMLADAVGSRGEWPRSRTETFERACRLMVEEVNEEHAVAFANSHVPPGHLVDDAGRLCAGLLLADCDGYTLHQAASDARYPVPERLVAEPEGEPRAAATAGHVGTGGAGRLRRALRTRLFTSPGDGRRSPVHRQVAEFLAARHVARLIEEGLPVRRVLALVTGGDGVVVTALRSLSAWLAALCRRSGVRRELIERDPVGVALYGDATGFTPRDKRRLLEAVHREATRLVDFPAAAGVGSFVTRDLEPALLAVLDEPSRGREHQTLVFFVLRAAGGPLPGASKSLLDVVRDDGWYPDVRGAALGAFIRTAPEGHDTTAALVGLLDEVGQGSVSDPDDALRGALLSHLFPDALSASRLCDYLPERGGGTRFWGSLPERATDADVAVLLDRLARLLPAPDAPVVGREQGALDPVRTGLNTMDLLARGLDAQGDALNARRLYDWLGVGLVSRSHAENLEMLSADGDGGAVQRVRAWLTARPGRQREIVAEGLRRWTAAGHPVDGPGIDDHLYTIKPPADFGRWCLEQAFAAADPRAADYLLDRAVHAAVTGVGAAGLSVERLQERTEGHDRLRQRLRRLLSSLVDPSRDERRPAWLAKDERRRQDWRQVILSHATALRENRCPPALLYPLAAAYLGYLPEGTEDSPRGRLRRLLAPDNGLVDAALAGLRGAPARADVPAAEDVLRRAALGEEYHLALPVLAGMVEIDAAAPDGPLPLDQRCLRSALAFRCTKPVLGPDTWYRRAVRSHPDVVADVLRRHGTVELRKGRPSVPALYALVDDEGHRDVAARAVLPLLRAFPTRCRNAQCEALMALLRTALRWADRSELRGLIEKKLGARSMNAAQRTPWLAAGLAAAPHRWRGPLEEFVQGRDPRIRRLAAFFVTGSGPDLLHGMETPDLALLIRLLGPAFGPYRARGGGGLSLAVQASLAIGEMTDRLAAVPDRAASEALENLSSDPGLSAWREPLARARGEQRIVSRDAAWRPPGIDRVRRTLANGPPANAGDLAALLEDRMGEFAGAARTGNASAWRMFWNEGPHHTPFAPKHEESCRDALLVWLQERLPPAVDAQPEGCYANDRRADVRVACGDFQVPIEIKKDSSPDLWSALHDQLLAHYAQDPATDGYGLYLVLRFGEGVQPPPDGPPPGSAPELEARLTASLSAAQARKISVCVLDVSRPPAGRDLVSGAADRARGDGRATATG